MALIGNFPQTRLRRLRHTARLRSLVRETILDPSSLILPLFVKQNIVTSQPIISMPGHNQLSLSELRQEISNITSLGIKNIMLFGIPADKDPEGIVSYNENGIIPQSIKIIKNQAPELLVITDVCLCSYTDHGHCGLLQPAPDYPEGVLDNDSTLPILAQQAVSHAKAGADIVAPSGMIDGMVKYIRQGLDQAGFINTPILSYAVKYASAMYGPFRQAADGAPAMGDRSTHQLDVANYYEALRECALDIQEGADMLMIKPAHTYLDIISLVKKEFPALPLVAYHTSGEYAMLKAAAQQGWLDERLAVLEVLTAIRRSGANCIITYFAKEVFKWLNK